MTVWPWRFVYVEIRGAFPCEVLERAVGIAAAQRAADQVLLRDGGVLRNLVGVLGRYAERAGLMGDLLRVGQRAAGDRSEGRRAREERREDEEQQRSFLSRHSALTLRQQQLRKKLDSYALDLAGRAFLATESAGQDCAASRHETGSSKLTLIGWP